MPAGIFRSPEGIHIYYTKIILQVGKVGAQDWIMLTWKDNYLHKTEVWLFPSIETE